ncbi:MAG: 30S ribosomal protein S4 [Chloroflexi bacterium]|nr:30S ribosomal protein S4 [Chloroflexota bacterium]
MARYTEAVCRLCRRMSEKLMLKGERCFTPKCAVERRGVPPGEHSARRRRMSERGVQLREKQKVRYIYGVLERQMNKYFEAATRKRGKSGEILLQLLERRLDNVVYRLGFADSRGQARQLVMHGHLTLNGRNADIPSLLIKEGDTIGWRPSSIKTEYYKTLIKEIKNKSVPPWLSLDMQTLTGKVLSLPQRTDIESKIEDRLVVEYYAR